MAHCRYGRRSRCSGQDRQWKDSGFPAASLSQDGVHGRNTAMSARNGPCSNQRVSGAGISQDHALYPNPYSVPHLPKSLPLRQSNIIFRQIEAECQKFGAVQNISSACIYGGVPIGPQKQALAKGVHVVIATPGMHSKLPLACLNIMKAGSQPLLFSHTHFHSNSIALAHVTSNCNNPIPSRPTC